MTYLPPLGGIESSPNSMGNINKPTMRGVPIPTPAVRRLSLYLRELETFDASGVKTVSSRSLGEALGLSDAQVRKDLAYFGQFGHPGIGYRVDELIRQVKGILGTDKRSNVVLIGIGNLGRALISYRGFTKRGFELVAALDNDPNKIGWQTPPPHSLKVQSIAELPAVVKRYSVRIGLLAVPAPAGQAVAQKMVEAGIRGILNFAPVTLHVGHGVVVAPVDLSIHLEQLAFQVSGAVSTPDH